MPGPADRDQIETGLRNLLHHAIEARLDHAGLAATVKALVDTLVASGALAPEAFERNRQRALDVAVEELAERPLVEIGKAVDKYAVASPDVDCAALLPLCRARCCAMTVCLSAQDLDERALDWDYGRPYQIRRREDGYCAHSEPDTRRCGAYARRPAVCRSYDCRKDPRVWIDFDQRIPCP
jgi:hypothetical protein